MENRFRCACTLKKGGTRQTVEVGVSRRRVCEEESHIDENPCSFRMEARLCELGWGSELTRSLTSTIDEERQRIWEKIPSWEKIAAEPLPDDGTVRESRRLLPSCDAY